VKQIHAAREGYRRVYGVRKTWRDDINCYVASDFAIAFALTRDDREPFLAAGNDLTQINGRDAWLRPAPSLFVIDKASLIRIARVDGDCTRRIEPTELLTALAALGG
jgi:hypothetical protein